MNDQKLIRFNQLKCKFEKEVFFNKTVMVMLELLGAGLYEEDLKDAVWFTRFVKTLDLGKVEAEKEEISNIIQF